METQATSCINCNREVGGNYCSHCGHALRVKRITFGSLVHEVFHTFTHLDKGYGFTLKQLTRRPGHMQREFLAGSRAMHQKPFSYFFIHATLCALVSYWVSTWVANNSPEDLVEGNFFRHYFALTQVVLLPLYAATAWLIWKVLLRTTYNYGELLVHVLYLAGTFMLMISLIVLLKFIWPRLETRYIEAPLLVLYNLITNLNFFRNRRLLVLLGTLLSFGINYTVSNAVAGWLMSFLGH